jgi:archaeosortase B (VPXXXP-CTERM-specific)
MTEDSPSAPGAPPASIPSAPSAGPAAQPAGPQPARLFARTWGLWQNPANRFVVLFLVYLAALAFFYPRVSLRYADAVERLSELTALLSSLVFEPFSDSIRHRGVLIVFGGFAVEIIEECTGLYEMLIYAAAVFAFPTTLVKKAIGIAMGVPLLYAANVARISFLVWVGRYYEELFDFMHLYFWQATLILMITSVWLLWIFKVVRREAPAHTA